MAGETREKKRGGWQVPQAGCAGFALGAAAVLLIVWLYRKEPSAPAAPPGAVPPVSATPAPARPGPGRQTPQAPQPGLSMPPRSAVPPPADLTRRGLLLPVQGIPPQALQDTFDDARSAGRIHDAIDILAPQNTPVLAVDAGRVAKLFTSDLGGLTVYQFDPTETYTYYYAHLDHYAPGLKEGNLLTRGQVIGYVGSTGNASPDAPHLHFAITRMGPDKKWWQGEAINPYPVLRGR